MLEGALQDALQKMGSLEAAHTGMLSTKQNEMFQLAVRYQLPVNMRNEALGLWYEARTQS